MMIFEAIQREDFNSLEVLGRLVVLRAGSPKESGVQLQISVIKIACGASICWRFLISMHLGVMFLDCHEVVWILQSFFDVLNIFQISSVQKWPCWQCL